MYYLISLPTLKSPVKNEFVYQQASANSDTSSKNLNPGDLVKVPLKNKEYLGIVLNKTRKPKFSCRAVISIVYADFLSKDQLETAAFIAKYFLCQLAQVINLMLPPQLDTPKSLKMLAENRLSPKENQNKLKALNKLHKVQKEVYENILKQPSKIHLIHGVTGSGKTEIYLQLAKQYLVQNKQVLILIPEISLTPQIQAKFTQHFGDDNVVIYNSSLNKTQKLQAFLDIKNNNKQIAIGARSSCFLPFTQLGLVIMDEEHDSAFKQESTPKYHTKTIFQHLVKTHSALGILGSATPSLESYHAATKGIIQYHSIKDKAFKQEAPEIEIINMSDQLKFGNYPISDTLENQLQANLKAKKQAIILCNKRGFASYQQCRDCGFVDKCPNCDISFTLHKHSNPTLKCHYCDNKKLAPSTCHECGSIELSNKGLGVQQIQEELALKFPQANIVRVDSDSMGRKDSYYQLHQKLLDASIDIIIGTQIVATGLSFENVGLVAVINLDTQLNIPDFRSLEKKLFLLNQVTGRTNRKTSDGKVLIQTFNPEQPILSMFEDKNIHKFYSSEIDNRKKYDYPPFSKLTLIEHKHRSLTEQAKEIQRVENLLGKNQINYKSAQALIYKRNNYYYHNILINSLCPAAIIDKLDLKKDWSFNRDPLKTI